jgi:hypothetical protein
MSTAVGRQPRSVRVASTEPTPTGIHIGLGVPAVVAAVMVAALMPASAGGWRLVPVAAALVVIGACTVDPLAVAAITALAFLLVVGFLLNRYGTLTWHGMSDIYRFVAVSGASGAGLTIGAVRRWLQQRRRFTIPLAWSTGTPVAAEGLTLTIKEEGPGV